MKRTKIAQIFADADSFGGKEITVCGWARTIRDMKNIGFIELNDGSCFKSLQVVLERGKLDNYDDIARQNVGAAFIVHGELVLTPDAKQPFELKADSITLEGASAPDYPLQKKRHSVEFLRTIQHLRPRTNLFSATFRVRSVAAHLLSRPVLLELCAHYLEEGQWDEGLQLLQGLFPNIAKEECPGRVG